MKSIADKFSQAAPQYEALSDIQLHIAERLIQQCEPLPHGANVLDVGTGTGRVGRLLLDHYSDLHVYGLDVARGMLDSAVQHDAIHYVLGDASQLPFERNAFDLVISGSTYQWVHHLPQAFTEARRCLKKGQQFVVAMFGAKTFEEMFVVLREAGDRKKAYHRLPSVREVQAALDQSGLEDLELAIDNQMIVFQDLRSLLRWLKNIGANGLNEPGFLGKQQLLHAENVYRDMFPMGEGIQVSFETLWITARKG